MVDNTMREKKLQGIPFKSDAFPAKWLQFFIYFFIWIKISIS